MFQLTSEEADFLRCQTGTSKKSHGGRRYLPYVFTQEGVAMLSGVLNSERAVQVNIAIMRAFVRFREFLPKTKTSLPNSTSWSANSPITTRTSRRSSKPSANS